MIPSTVTRMPTTVVLPVTQLFNYINYLHNHLNNVISME